MLMNNNKKTNLLIFFLIVIIVLLSSLLIYIIVTDKKDNTSKNNNTSSTTTSTTTSTKAAYIEKKELITKDDSGNEYYALFIDPEDEYQTLKIVSTKDRKNYQDILDLSMSLMTGYEDAPYNGYKIEDGALYYINNEYDSGYSCSGELKVTLKDNKYNITSTGKNYKAIAGIKC